jgi:hypothetical protein
VLQRGQAEYLEPLVRAEAILNDPNRAQDQALLASWQHYNSSKGADFNA